MKTKLTLQRTTRKLVVGKPVRIVLKVSGKSVNAVETILDYDMSVLEFLNVVPKKGRQLVQNSNYHIGSDRFIYACIYCNAPDPGIDMSGEIVYELNFKYLGGTTEVKMRMSPPPNTFVDDYLGTHILPVTIKNAIV